MNFKQATDELLEPVTLEDLARVLGVSTQAVRQARAAEGSTAHRSPPPGWAKAVKGLAQNRAGHYQRLAQRVK